MQGDQLQSWLSAFKLDELLIDHVSDVLSRLPSAVRMDLVDDPHFSLADYDSSPGRVAHIPVGLPGKNRASRSVVLKRSLARRPEPFVKYVIAHELAHAHLRNGGRFPGEDPERAADALAAAWGFPRPY